jgi:acyl-CoA synthetase (AMP-forming)/AMP-acid ligase II
MKIGGAVAFPLQSSIVGFVGKERDMPITDFLERNAREYGDEISLIEVNPDLIDRDNLSWKEYSLVEASHVRGYRKTLTWGDFNGRADRTAELLLETGVSKGDKVALLLMNCIEWLPVYFGILKAGAVVVPLNYRYTSDEIKYCLGLADVSVLVFGPEFVERVDAARGGLSGIKAFFFIGDDCPAYARDYEGSIAACSGEAPGVVFSDGDDAAVYYSYGTTGFPKAILHTHASLVSACVTERAHHGQERGDVFLCIPPLYHTGAKMHWFGSLISGGRAVLLRGTSPKWILDAVAKERVSIVWLLVPWAQDILDAIESGEVELSGYDLTCWRLMHIGAQPVPPTLIRRWKEVFPSHAYDTNYGLSESIGPGAVHLGLENIRKVGAIGKAGYGWKTRIADESGADVVRGDVGELAVSGPGVMKCYYKDPEATAAVLKDGWLYTGDMAMEDGEGFIFLVDRKKDVVITGGENIYPVQIEDFLRGFEKIKDVAVIGVPDKRLGEIAAAVIELKPGAVSSREEIMRFAGELPRYKRPRVIIFDRVPRNPTGKIEKPALRAKYAGGSVVAQETGTPVKID